MPPARWIRLSAATRSLRSAFCCSGGSFANVCQKARCGSRTLMFMQLAHIARAAGVPLGNVYYYFKTKEDIGQAVIARRANHYEELRAQWEQLPDPRARLRAFIQMTIDNRELLARSGCPIGSLCQELHKEGGPLAEQAGAMFTALLTWLEAQFHLLGKGNDASDLALHLLSALEGASLLTHTFGEPDLMLRETARLQNWLATL